MSTVTHIAGFALRVGNKARQLCAWCGVRLIDDDYDLMAFAPGCDTEPKYYGPNALVEVVTDGNMTQSAVVAAVDGELPRNCCAKEPVKLRSVPQPSPSGESGGRT